jgi:LysR family hydrogen peroxide-inducible transcriptional activator
MSAQIAQLERTLGVVLFERSRARVLPTPAGAALLVRARELLERADDLNLSVARAHPLEGTLRIGVIPTLAPYLLPALTPAIRKRHPKLVVRWVEEKTAHAVERLERGDLDAILVAAVPELGACERAVIGEDPFMLAAPPNHPLAKGGPLRVSALDGADVLVLEEGHCFGDQALDVCARAGAHEVAFRATSLSTLAQMVGSGAGITLLPALAAETEAKRARLALRPFKAPAPSRTIALAWRRRSPLKGALEDLATTMRAAYPAPAL